MSLKVFDLPGSWSSLVEAYHSEPSTRLVSVLRLRHLNWVSADLLAALPAPPGLNGRKRCDQRAKLPTSKPPVRRPVLTVGNLVYLPKLGHRNIVSHTHRAVEGSLSTPSNCPCGASSLPWVR